MGNVVYLLILAACLFGVLQLIQAFRRKNGKADGGLLKVFSYVIYILETVIGILIIRGLFL